MTQLHRDMLGIWMLSISRSGTNSYLETWGQGYDKLLRSKVYETPVTLSKCLHVEGLVSSWEPH